MITEMLVNTASVHIFNHLFVPFQKTYTCKPWRPPWWGNSRTVVFKLMSMGRDLSPPSPIMHIEKIT